MMNGMETESAPTGSRKILVVEDDEGIRETIRFALELEGYDVLTAENGRVALSVLESKANPVLILLDLMMPVMSGWEFIEELKKDAVFNRIPVVVVTAVGDHTKVIDAVAVIKKPIDLSVLYEVVKKYHRVRL